MSPMDISPWIQRRLPHSLSAKTFAIHSGSATTSMRYRGPQSASAARRAPSATARVVSPASCCPPPHRPREGFVGRVAGPSRAPQFPLPATRNGGGELDAFGPPTALVTLL